MLSVHCATHIVTPQKTGQLVQYIMGFPGFLWLLGNTFPWTGLFSPSHPNLPQPEKHRDK